MQTATLTLTQIISSITIFSITNPYPSQTALKITLNFYNSSNPTVVVDTCSASLTFSSLSLSSTAITYSFNPGNVSTQSNLTLSLVPYLWTSSNMYLKISFLTYWSRNLLNVSSNKVISSMSYCSPVCTINNMGNFFAIEFSSLSLLNFKISVTIFNILTPATMEPADTITISII